MPSECPSCRKPWEPVDVPLVMLAGGFIGFFGGALTAFLIWGLR